MYTGKQLGEAIRIAIDRKLAQGVRKKDIAAHFQIKEPSIADWIKKGSIDKEKLPRLWRYFADVAGLEHWGFTATDFECFGLSRQPKAAARRCGTTGNAAPSPAFLMLRKSPRPTAWPPGPRASSPKQAPPGRPG